ncbi:MAG: two-component system, OmpR family, sensor histidine kinase MprB [Acidimicrobiaceae bacterium]|nr:two-component system, OmpR family, sensor histidine kinase MprB [Acidimicrobiaceae bacterium]
MADDSDLDYLSDSGDPADSGEPGEPGDPAEPDDASPSPSPSKPGDASVRPGKPGGAQPSEPGGAEPSEGSGRSTRRAKRGTSVPIGATVPIRRALRASNRHKALNRHRKLPRRVSFRTRLVALAAAAVGISVALASAACYVGVRRTLVREVDNQLRRQADLIETRRFRPEIPSLAGITGPLQRSGLNSFMTFQVITANGTVVIPNTPALPITATDRAVAAGKQGETFRSVGSSGKANHVRVLTVSVGGGYAVQLARPLVDIDRTLRHLALILLLVAATGVAFSLVLGYLIGKTSLRPVEDLTEAVERVGATGHLDERIDVTGDDELSRLATSFNQMLAALGESRRQQTQLVADAGHELRTPLTSLRTNIEVLLRAHDLPDADRTALFGDITAQLTELSTLVGDLVELARDEEQRPEPEDVRVDLVVEDAVERARRRAPMLTFNLDVQDALVRAQPALLERAVLNVLDNAAKWSPEASTVEVTVRRSGPSWRLEVRDHGPGITDEDLPHVFDRFYRSATARWLPGSGLGLAIVRQVVESSGGAVSAINAADGGTVVRIDLPAVDLTDAASGPGDAAGDATDGASSISGGAGAPAGAGAGADTNDSILI